MAADDDQPDEAEKPDYSDPNGPLHGPAHGEGRHPRMISHEVVVRNRDWDEFGVAVLERKACELRRDGYTYPQIAEKMGSSVSTAHARVHRAIRKTIKEPSAHAKQLELDRLDKLLATMHEIIDDPKTATQDRVAASNTAIRLSESRRKLEGMDAPTKMEHRVFDALDTQIEALAAELKALDENVSVDRDEEPPAELVEEPADADA